MRLWTLHPCYLDGIGLVALWRESLLARKVLSGNTRGYKNHPQLQRFKAFEDPISAINKYLQEVYTEATHRKYRFSSTKLGEAGKVSNKMPVSSGQILYELEHLRRKIAIRTPQQLHLTEGLSQTPASIRRSELFSLIDGPIEAWEKLSRFGNEVSGTG